jgi:transcriptional regulator with XRE-family HTH domain
MALLRRLIGDVLRAQRLRQNRTLREVSAAARVSLGYLSEVERGQKEASSELLAAICTALGVRLADLLRDVSDSLGAVEPLAVPETVPDTVPALEPVGADAPLVFADRGATGAAIPLVSEHAHRAVVAA